ncbi:MAG TPA: ABC transporter ATP-binding protein [Candidatus Paceibacterota bacterium]|jgi:ABC-type multidrug transport system, ATPase and permease components
MATTIQSKRPNVFAVLAPYKGTVAALVVFTIGSNALNLVVPRLVARGIDSYVHGTFNIHSIATTFVLVALGMLVLSLGQAAYQAYVSERAARDLRKNLADKISQFSYARLEEESPERLLTNLTSDIDAIKMFASNAIVQVISSVCLIIGSAAILLYMDWKLALVVLAIIPAIGGIFALVFKSMGPLFYKSQGIIDRLNASINESILGAALVRVFNSRSSEIAKFRGRNDEARDNGMKILRLFSMVIPLVGIIANAATVGILALGGHFIIAGSMTLGEFTAFQSYLFLLIFPIIILGFMSSVISRAQASYGRIVGILSLPDEVEPGTIEAEIRGDIEVRNLSVRYGEKQALKDVSFSAKAGEKVAIVGPTAAGKTQLLYALIGLLKPTSGEVLYDGKLLTEYRRKSLHKHVAIVFQDSVMFNLPLRDNIAFGSAATVDPEAREAALAKAIRVAELEGLVAGLPAGLDSVVSERGTSLSGGQKQRVMLARALVLNPKVLLLDDFTARVDAATEQKILENVSLEYPGTTVISVTQKVSSAATFDKVVLLMEGEALAVGTHKELLGSSPEYVQIAESQKSTNVYELRS